MNLGARIHDLVTHLEGLASYKNDTFPQWEH